MTAGGRRCSLLWEGPLLAVVVSIAVRWGSTITGVGGSGHAHIGV